MFDKDDDSQVSVNNRMFLFGVGASEPRNGLQGWFSWISWFTWGRHSPFFAHLAFSCVLTLMFTFTTVNWSMETHGFAYRCFWFDMTSSIHLPRFWSDHWGLYLSLSWLTEQSIPAFVMLFRWDTCTDSHTLMHYERRMCTIPLIPLHPSFSPFTELT